MDDIVLGSVISIGSFALLAGIFLFAQRRKAQQIARMLVVAAERGWTCNPINAGRVSGYRFEGHTHGVNWTLESTLTTSPAASGSGTITSHARHTRWQSADAILAEGLVLIGPRSGNTGPIPDLGKVNGLAGMRVRKALQLMLGEDAAHFPGLQEVQLGTGALYERFMVWAHDARAARRLLSLEVARALMDGSLKNPLVVKLSPRGLRIDVQGAQLEDPATLEQLVELGVRLVAAWRQ